MIALLCWLALYGRAVEQFQAAYTDFCLRQTAEYSADAPDAKACLAVRPNCSFRSLTPGRWIFAGDGVFPQKLATRIWCSYADPDSKPLVHAMKGRSRARKKP